MFIYKNIWLTLFATLYRALWDNTSSNFGNLRCSLAGYSNGIEVRIVQLMDLQFWGTKMANTSKDLRLLKVWQTPMPPNISHLETPLP